MTRSPEGVDPGRVRDLRVAVASDGQKVAEHFGRCSQYILFDVNSRKIQGRTVVESPGHEPGFLPGYLAQFGVHQIICGGMGPRAQSLFAQQGIRPIVGVLGPVDLVIQRYLEGTLQPGTSTCSHGKGEHSCTD